MTGDADSSVSGPDAGTSGDRMSPVYLYAVTRADAGPLAVRGVDDAPVDLLTAGGLGVVASEVDPDTLAALRDTGADLRVVADLARRHDEVVRAALAAGGGVLPFRLGTVVASRGEGERLLADRSDQLRSALDRVADAREWGVEVAAGAGAERAGPAGPVPAPERAGGAPRAPAEGGAGVGPGTAYLLRRRRELAAGEERRRTRDEAVHRVTRPLRAGAVDVVAGRAHGAHSVLHESYLVRQADEAAFLEAVDRCGDEVSALGLTLHLTGPLPPYSFSIARLEDPADG